MKSDWRRLMNVIEWLEDGETLHISGVYFLMAPHPQVGSEVVYVGQSHSILARLLDHDQARSSGRMHWTSWQFIRLPPHQLNRAEAAFIALLQPKYNKQLKHGGIGQLPDEGKAFLDRLGYRSDILFAGAIHTGDLSRWGTSGPDPESVLGPPPASPKE